MSTHDFTVLINQALASGRYRWVLVVLTETTFEIYVEMSVVLQEIEREERAL